MTKLSLCAALAIVGCGPSLAHAQFGTRAVPAGGATIPLTIRSTEFLPSRASAVRYASLLDMRRRIIANETIRIAGINGTWDPFWTLANDLSLPLAQRDRLEVYWGWDYVTPEATARGTAFNTGTPPPGFPYAAAQRFRFDALPGHAFSLRHQRRGSVSTAPSVEHAGKPTNE
jgi:hypothetical protein